MLFGKKKEEQKQEQEQPTPIEKGREFAVTLTLWDGKQYDTTVVAQFSTDFQQMAKNVIREGLFVSEDRIVRVNEVQLRKDKTESEVVN